MKRFNITSSFSNFLVIIYEERLCGMYSMVCIYNCIILIYECLIFYKILTSLYNFNTSEVLTCALFYIILSQNSCTCFESGKEDYWYIRVFFLSFITGYSHQQLCNRSSTSVFLFSLTLSPTDDQDLLNKVNLTVSDEFQSLFKAPWYKQKIRSV